MNTKQRIINEGQHILTKEDKQNLINTGTIPVKHPINPNDYYTRNELAEILDVSDRNIIVTFNMRNGDKVKGSDILKLLKVSTILFLFWLLTCCSSPRMICPVFKDTYNNRKNYKAHWMNRKFDTNILYYDTENYFTTKWDKKYKK